MSNNLDYIQTHNINKVATHLFNYLDSLRQCKEENNCYIRNICYCVPLQSIREWLEKPYGD